jgi:hypothetical protein
MYKLNEKMQEKEYRDYLKRSQGQDCSDFRKYLFGNGCRESGKCNWKKQGYVEFVFANGGPYGRYCAGIKEPTEGGKE